MLGKSRSRALTNENMTLRIIQLSDIHCSDVKTEDDKNEDFTEMGKANESW
jgi:predicted MPP superfamily phosphohydrolase